MAMTPVGAKSPQPSEGFVHSLWLLRTPLWAPPGAAFGILGSDGGSPGGGVSETPPRATPRARSLKQRAWGAARGAAQECIVLRPEGHVNGTKR